MNFGGFYRGFSWRIFLGTFSHKNEEKKSATKSAKKSGGPKIEIRKESVLPTTGPEIGGFQRGVFARGGISIIGVGARTSCNN